MTLRIGERATVHRHRARFARAAQKGEFAYIRVIMKISATAEHFSWLTRKELFGPTERLDAAVRIAQAIAQLMDPEWREPVHREQRKKRRIASLALLKA